LVKRTHPECERCLLVDALIREVLEYLLKRCLADTVLLNVHFLFLSLNLTEQVTYRLVLTRNTNLVEVSTLLQELNLSKLTGQRGNKLEAI